MPRLLYQDEARLEYGRRFWRDAAQAGGAAQASGAGFSKRAAPASAGCWAAAGPGSGPASEPPRAMPIRIEAQRVVMAVGAGWAAHFLSNA